MEYIAAAQNGFRVHYAHRSHGSQITVGLGLIEAGAGAYAVAVESLNLPGETGALCIYTGMPGNDYPYPEDYSNGVQAFLDSHPTVNVSMFSWCDEPEDMERGSGQRLPHPDEPSGGGESQRQVHLHDGERPG